MPSSVSGRNNTMVSYVGKLCRLKIPIEDAVNSALAKDKELHGSNALFEDATEYPKFKFTTPRDGAVNMVTRIYKKDAEGKQEKAETNNEVNICFDIEETKNGKVKLIPNYNRFVDYAIKNFHCYCTDGTMIYKYNNQYYYDVFSQGEIYKLIRKLSLRNSTNKQCNEFYLTLQKDAWGLDKEKIIPEKMINLSNGIYDYKQKTLLPHDPKYLFKYKLNYNFDKNIKLIYDNEFHFENIFFKILNNDILLLKQLQQIMAYILIGGTPWLHKCFVLFGGGRNGKSTILDTLKALIGDSFYSTLSMGDLSHDFKPSMLDGKIANFCDESPSGKLIDSESFKNLTAGGEFIVNMKNKAPYTARCHARFVFSCNKLPKYDEQSLAINERMIFIPFDQTFTDESAVKDIFNTYIKPQMSLIFNWAIDAIDSVYELGIPTCPANDVVKQQFLIESDSVMNWFECRIKFNWSDQIRINTDYLYQDYRNYYDDDIKRPVGKDEFSKRLKIIFKNKLIEFKKTKYKEDELIIRKIQILEKNIEGFRYREDGNRVRGYIGIEINDNLLEEFGLN